MVIGMDVAASEFYRNGKYDLDFKSPDDPSRHITGEKLGDLYKSFIKNYPGKSPPDIPVHLPEYLATIQHTHFRASIAINSIFLILSTFAFSIQTLLTCHPFMRSSDP